MMKKLFRSFGFGFAIKLLDATEMSGVFLGNKTCFRYRYNLCDFIIEHAKKDTADVLKLPINVAFIVRRLCLLTELVPAYLLLIMDN